MSEIEKDTNNEEKIQEHFEKQLERTNYWLSFAEAKNGALIAINIALIAALIASFERAPIFCAISCGVYLVSCFFCLYSFFPNTNSKPEDKKSSNITNINLLFYGDIANIENTEKFIELSVSKYFEVEKVSVKKALIYDLASEILINSQITARKYIIFKKALMVDFVAILFTFVFVCAA